MLSEADRLGILFLLVPGGCLLLVASVLLVVPSLWAATVGTVDKGRNHTVDGVRGLLTLWVLTHHLNALPIVMATRAAWIAPTGTLGQLMNGGLFVAPFFVLTALIFGGSLIANGGELRTVPFLTKRLFRLIPVYLVSILLIFAAVLAISRFKLHVSLFQLGKEFVRWSLLDFVPRYGINDIDASEAHGMLWTLRVELIFYMMLPPLAFLQRRLRSPAPLFAGLAIAAWFSPLFLFFMAGLVAAVALGWSRGRFRTAWQVAAVAAIALLIATSAIAITAFQAALLVPIAVALVQEAWPFTLLRWRPLRFVGEVSYSVYILHHPIIWIVYSTLLLPGPTSALPYVPRVLIAVACGSLILTVSTVAFVRIERPGVRLGRRLLDAGGWRPAYQALLVRARAGRDRRSDGS